MRTRKRDADAKLAMTPMIDVVFQLLVFFIVTLQAPDILAHLRVARPQPTITETKDEDPALVTAIVSSMGWTLNGRVYTSPQGEAAMARHLARIASFSRTVSVVIKCTGDSPHSNLVRLLNICSHEGLDNLAVFSL